MSVMVASLYDDLVNAGAKDAVARKADEEAAGYEDKFGKLENRISILEAKINMLQWMMGINLALTAGILFKLLG